MPTTIEPGVYYEGIGPHGGHGTYVPPRITMDVKTFQHTLGFWMIWSVVIGAMLGAALCELLHLLHWLP